MNNCRTIISLIVVLSFIRAHIHIPVPVPWFNHIFSILFPTSWSCFVRRTTVRHDIAKSISSYLKMVQAKYFLFSVVFSSASLHMFNSIENEMCFGRVEFSVFSVKEKNRKKTHVKNGWKLVEHKVPSLGKPWPNWWDTPEKMDALVFSI